MKTSESSHGRVLLHVCLAGLLVLAASACGRIGQVLPRVVHPVTPHEEYVRFLKASGQHEAGPGLEWLAAAERALASPTSSKLPLSTRVTYTALVADAYGYRFELRRGRVFEVTVSQVGPDPGPVFIDLFRERPDDGRGLDQVASAGRESLFLSHEVSMDGTYVLRVQPELLRSGSLAITPRTTASLTFPVADRDSRAIQSFFLDPRDGGRRAHHGVDIFAPRNTPVVAAADGWVTQAGTNTLGGHVVWVWDPSRQQSHYYAHLESQAVTPGARVRAGDIIGRVGNTGNARTAAPHLHFGIYVHGEGPIDPLPFVQGARGPAPNPH